MKKINWKKGAVAAVTAGLMMSALPTMAMAAPVSDAAAGLTKNWTVENATQFKNGQNFSFKVQLTKIDTKGVSGNVGFKVGDFKNVTVSQDWAKEADGLTSSKTITRTDLFKDWDFALPGVYTFTITENPLTGEDANANVKIDKDTSFTANVNVVWDTNKDGTLKLDKDGKPIAKVESAGVIVEGKKGQATFNNTPADNSNVTVTKQVKGAFADTNKDFSYTLKLTGPFTGSYQVMKNGVEAAKTNTNGEATFTLKNGETATIENLPLGVTYTITETDEANYDETNTVNGKNSKDGLVATGTVKAYDDAVVFTNTSNGVPSTGVIVNTIPYIAAGGVAVAGAVTLVISRNRRQHEDF